MLHPLIPYTLVNTEKKNIDTQKKDIDTQKKDIDTQKKDITTQKKDIDTQKKDIDTQKKDIDTLKKEPINITSKVPPLLKKSGLLRDRRSSISAESLSPSLRLSHKVVINKSEEQRQKISRAVKDNFLFSKLDEEQYNDIVNAMDEKTFEKGDMVITQGTEGDYFYIVESGELDCIIDQKKIMSYTSGGSFGELALMYNAPRAASIIALSDCVLYALDRVTFRLILMENTDRKRHLYEQFLSEVPIFKSLLPYERLKIADALESISFNDKDVVIRQGDTGNSFYIIESGEAVFYRARGNDKQEQVMIGRKGDYFGELNLLYDTPRAATVVSRGKLKCVTLDKNAFTRLLGPVMDIIKRNSKNYPE
ncbi:cyclic nucleotide-binding-like protein [Pilobolus umbonatus]|nr:cyclic nucleotide-binding-like protein [Pilobolus umbonatus]